MDQGQADQEMPPIALSPAEKRAALDSCGELQGDYVRAFSDYKDFVLGEYVWGLNAKDEEGKTVSSPPWSLVLSYERAIRKEAAKKVREGTPYPTALREAWRDPTVKERHFATPLALHSKRPAPEIPWHPGEYPVAKTKERGRPRKEGSLCCKAVRRIRQRVIRCVTAMPVQACMWHMFWKTSAISM